MERLDKDLTRNDYRHFILELNAINEAWKAIGGKWKLKLILALAHGEKRFNELKEYVTGISPRALSKELKELEKSGLVSRLVGIHHPVAVSYQLTEIALKLNDVIHELQVWSLWYKEEFLESQLDTLSN